jgi:hypothetical protein
MTTLLLLLLVCVVGRRWLAALVATCGKSSFLSCVYVRARKNGEGGWSGEYIKHRLPCERIKFAPLHARVWRCVFGWRLHTRATCILQGTGPLRGEAAYVWMMVSKERISTQLGVHDDAILFVIGGEMCGI